MSLESREIAEVQPIFLQSLRKEKNTILQIIKQSVSLT